MSEQKQWKTVFILAIIQCCCNAFLSVYLLMKLFS